MFRKCSKISSFFLENKELLTYLLFEAHDTEAYIKSVIQEMDSNFETINKSNAYFVKKTLRKILRITNKFIRYSGSDIVATELLIHFCKTVQQMDRSITTNQVIINIYQNQLKKINKAIAAMHEDLQYDYLKEVKDLSN